MSDDNSNPFAKLAKKFAEQEAREAGDSFPAAKHSPGMPGGKRRRAGPGESDNGEAALFLDAMSRIKPLAKRGRGTQGQGQSLGEKLAAKMKNGPDSGAAGKNRDRRDAALFRTALGQTPASEAAMPPPSALGNQQRPEENFARMLDSLEKKDSAPDTEDLALFTKAMQGVAPVSGKGRDIAVPAGAAANSLAVDPAKALRDVLEGKVEFALHHTDEYMEGFVVGVDPLVLARLRNGQYSPEKHVDLHGMNARQAYDALVLFIKNAYQRGMRCVVVVTGRGRNSPDGIGVLRPMLQRWLCREPFKRVVLAFCTAKPGDGGPGAAYVLLRKYKKSRGKIIWEHTPSDDDFPDL